MQFASARTRVLLIQTYSLNFVEHVDVVVGQDKQLFTVHKEEICSRSEFFRAACSAKWSKSTETEKGPIELPEEDPFVFDMHLHVVYKDRVDVGSLLEPIPGEEDIPEEDWVDSRLVKTYLLADRLCDCQSANLIIDDLIELYAENDACPYPQVTSIVANNTTQDSPLRQAFIDFLAYESGQSLIKKTCAEESIPREFICDVLIRKAKIGSVHRNGRVAEAFDRRYVSKQKKCHYHQHDDSYPICGDDCKRNSEDEVNVEESGEQMGTAENDS